MKNDLDQYYFYNGELVKNHSISSSSIPSSAVYEVMKIIDGKPLFFEDHMERFNKSINKQGYILNIPPGEILNEMAFLYQTNKVSDKNLKMIYIPIQDEEAFDFMMYFTPRKLLSDDEKSRGVIVKSVMLERHNPYIKTIGESYKNKIQEANDGNIFEFVLTNGEGLITEGSRSNVFFVKGDTVYTSSSSILLGVTRKKIISLCHENNIPVSYKTVSVKESYEMDSAFLTGTSIGVAPIARINEHKYIHRYKMIELLSQAYDKMVNNYVNTFVMPE